MQRLLSLALISFFFVASKAHADNAGTIQFASDSYEAYETAGSVTLTVLLNRTGNTNAPVSVQYQTMPGTADASRFTPVSGTLTFAAGSPVATITVAIINDTVVEPPQSFTVVLSNPTNATLDPNHSTATVTIQDDDGINTIQLDEATYGGVDEGFGNGLSTTDGSVQIRLRATRGADPNLTLTAQLVFDDETAVYGTDYVYGTQCSQRPTITVTFSPGITTQTIPVTLINPNVSHATCGATPNPGTTTFRVHLTSPSTFTTIGQQGSARVTIFRNSGQPNTVQFVTSATAIREGSQASIALHVVRYGEFSLSGSGTSVQYTTEVRAGDTAVSGVNFTAVSGSLTFNPVRSNGNVIAVEHDAFIVVPIPDNSLVQGDLTFHVTLLSADNAQLGDFSTIQVTIVDDDLGNTVAFVSPTYTVSEAAGNAVLTVQLGQNGDPSRAATIDYVATPITAFAGFDFSPVSGTLIFAPYETTKTILVPVFDDNIVEGSETFRVTLQNPGSGTLIGTPSNAVVTILDNDVPHPTPTPTPVPTPTPSPSPSSVGFATDTYSPAYNDTKVTLTVLLNRGYPDPGVVTVHFATADGTAVGNTDYVPQDGTVMFPAGQDQQTITIPLIPHNGTPGNRTFYVNLSSPNGAQLQGIQTATVTIFNPDLSTKLTNVSTRGSVEQGDDVMIAGVIVRGAGSKQVIVRGIGPSMMQYGVSGTLTDPNLTLYDVNGQQLAFNDNYGTNSAADLAVLAAQNLTPDDPRESAIVTALPAGDYTAILRGSTIGIGLVETYDVDGATTTSALLNISTRGKVEQNDNGVMIVGFIISAPTGQAGTAARVAIRAIGPSLAQYGIKDALADPNLTLYSGNTPILSNDNWTSNSAADQQELKDNNLAPSNAKEAALVTTLDPGAYTVVIRGKNNTTGVALAEVYRLSP